ncbi:hypothetical protein FEF65_10030 [Mariprofundus erugo]|uniref:pEK499-p136 HEPN domain-containing protein n=1 Tax=Mariprofundus erugo TaxID=2528639 RepID=A0A5R9GQE1_9PROT|nr:hypothetical protein [Mariprofundus erugo]TLS66497.1 hypothetical protein FEF65_10030 [Mariprofundus erugo]
MSAYKDYIRDYPTRCLALLDALDAIESQRVQLPKGLANIRKHNVTYILSLASTGIVVPWERLQKRHRSGDSVQFSESVCKLERLKGSCFIGSEVWPEQATGSWKFRKGLKKDSDVDGWALSAASMTKAKTSSCVLRVLRNALAHGNISVLGDPIDQIVFYSKEHDADDADYQLVVVSVSDFVKFLRYWIEFISVIEIPSMTFSDLDNAA